MRRFTLGFDPARFHVHNFLRVAQRCAIGHTRRAYLNVGDRWICPLNSLPPKHSRFSHQIISDWNFGFVRKWVSVSRPYDKWISIGTKIWYVKIALKHTPHRQWRVKINKEKWKDTRRKFASDLVPLKCYLRLNAKQMLWPMWCARCVFASASFSASATKQSFSDKSTDGKWHCVRACGVYVCLHAFMWQAAADDEHRG